VDFGLTGKTALVLGAGGGLGSAIAEMLAAEGAQIALGDIAEDAAQKVADGITAKGGKAIAIGWDLKNIEAVDANVARVEKELGGVDVLVNITGGPPPTPAAGQKVDLWRDSFEGMIMSVIAISDRVLPGMRTRKWGRIITSTSSGVVAPIPNLGISNALRLSLVGWSKTLAGEVGRDGVTSNIILPGRIATKRIRFLDEKKAEREGKKVEDVSAASEASIPLGRYGEPEEYAATVAFLASRQASYITGSVIRVDGGLIASV
jgi:3-oxoacyl-[acyl-carrier protein] reductase